MSMEVPLETLEAVAATLGDTAYAVVSDPDGPPRITHVTPQFAGSSVSFGLGRRSIQLIEQHGQLGLLWPAAEREAMSLIVDARVDEVHDDGRVEVTATWAVRHRPAPLSD